MDTLGTNSLAVLAAGTLAAFEIDRIKSLFDSDQSITKLIPDDIDPDVLWKSLGACSRVMGAGKKVVAQAKPLIGRMLVVVQGYPELYRQAGYQTFDDFMSEGLEKLFGIPRSEAYELKKIATILPDIDPQQCVALGTTKMGMIAKVVQQNNFNPEKTAGLMEYSKGKTIVGLRQDFEDKNWAGEGTLEFQNFIVTMAKASKIRLEEFLDRPEIQAYCESTSKGLILERMVQECELEWIGQGRAAMNVESRV